MKYKKLIKLKSFVNYPARVLKFKRSKWFIVKKLFTKRKRKKLFNLNTIVSKKKAWERLSRSYKNRLDYKRLLSVNFGRESLKKLSINSKDRQSIQNKLIYINYFRPKSILLTSKRKVTLDDSKNCLFKNILHLNGNLTKTNKVLTKGDVLYVAKSEGYLKQNIKNYPKNMVFASFYQYDPYSQTFVVLKNNFELELSEYSLLNLEQIEIEKLI